VNNEAKLLMMHSVVKSARLWRSGWRRSRSVVAANASAYDCLHSIPPCHTREALYSIDRYGLISCIVNRDPECLVPSLDSILMHSVLFICLFSLAVDCTGRLPFICKL
jgi:hypothetical protein